MGNLIKADLKRIRRDKMMIIIVILAVVFALITPLLYAALLSGIDTEGMEFMLGPINAKSSFFGSFSMGNNLGLIVPVLIAIILRKDFSQGTIRNKIIAGKSRTQIFLSMFAACAVTLILVMLFHAFVTLGISLLLFEYQATPFTISDYWYFMASLGFDLLLLLFIASFISWLCASMKNVGTVIVLYIAFTFVLTIISAITTTVQTVFEFEGGRETAVEILEIVNRINVANATSYIGTGTSYSLTDVLYITLPPLAGIAGFLGLSLMKFRKKDLK